MKANRMWLFSDVLEKNKRVFKVPVYQRNYDWTNIQCEKLFQDIMKAGENNRQHFTGTVVYIDDVNGGSGLNEVLISRELLQCIFFLRLFTMHLKGCRQELRMKFKR